jgi:hypothetical protein
MTTQQLALTFDASPAPAPPTPAPAQTDRALLGLPAGVPLDAESIRQAHRLAAARHHHAAGGDPVPYQALAGARDRLLQGLAPGAAP